MKLLGQICLVSILSACQVGLGGPANAPMIQSEIGPGSSGPKVGIGPGSTGPKTTQNIVSFFQTLGTHPNANPNVVTRVKLATANPILQIKRFELVLSLSNGSEQILLSSIVQANGEHTYTEAELRKVSSTILRLNEQDILNLSYRFYQTTEPTPGEQALFEVQPSFEYEGNDGEFEPDKDFNEMDDYFLELEVPEEFEHLFNEDDDDD